MVGNSLPVAVVSQGISQSLYNRNYLGNLKPGIAGFKCHDLTSDESRQCRR